MFKIFRGFRNTNEVLCATLLREADVKKMHKFCHSGAKPFSKGKDVSKTNYTTCLLIQEENLGNGGIVKSVENILPKPLS